MAQTLGPKKVGLRYIGTGENYKEPLTALLINQSE